MHIRYSHQFADHSVFVVVDQLTRLAIEMSVDIALRVDTQCFVGRRVNILKMNRTASCFTTTIGCAEHLSVLQTAYR